MGPGGRRFESCLPDHTPLSNTVCSAPEGRNTQALVQQRAVFVDGSEINFADHSAERRQPLRAHKFMLSARWQSARLFIPILSFNLLTEAFPRLETLTRDRPRPSGASKSKRRRLPLFPGRCTSPPAARVSAGRDWQPADLRGDVGGPSVRAHLQNIGVTEDCDRTAALAAARSSATRKRGGERFRRG